MSDDQQLVIEQAWDNRAELDTGDGELRDAVDAAIASLDDGSARVAQPDGDGGWQVKQKPEPPKGGAPGLPQAPGGGYSLW